MRAAVALVVLPTVVSGFYLPGVSPREYLEGERVELKVNKGGRRLSLSSPAKKKSSRKTQGTHLVFDDGDLLAVVLGQDPIQQRRLAGTQIASQHRDRDSFVAGLHGGVAVVRLPRTTRSFKILTLVTPPRQYM